MSNAELVLEARTDKYDPQDDRWHDQVAELLSELNRGGGKVRQESESVAGKKGDVSTIILALGSAGAITAAVEIVRAWLARDQTRSLRVKRGDDVIELDANRLSDGTFREFALKAFDMDSADKSNAS